MKRLMITAAMLAVVACGDDSSSGDDGDTTDETPAPTNDAGRDANRADARSSGGGGDDAGEDDDDDVQDAGKADATVATDAGKSDGGANGDPCATLTYASFGKAFEAKYCASCHAATVKGSARNDAPPDAVFDTLEQIQDAKALLKAFVVNGKTMPPSDSEGDKPTDAERTQFGQFLDCGPL
ncbi:MAG TPA: hypothetical protein VFX59_12775 [Polyangiales bacterium]|nr:hypothetical protein [Polyangiales bacterium]